MDEVGPNVVLPDELVGRARSMVAMLREQSEEAERNRSIPAESIEAMRTAGLFRALQPTKYGGFEHDFTTLADISVQIGRGCASSAWLCGLAIGNQWLIGCFPEQAQDEIWGDDPDAITFGVFTVTATAEKAQGGYRVSGSWRFASGCEFGEWFYVGVFLPPDGDHEQPYPAMLLVRTSDYAIDDDWYAAGLAATGSKRIVCDDVFVPAHRCLTFGDFVSGNTPGSRLHDNPMYAIPAMALIPYALCTPALGALQGAIDDFIADVGKRDTLSGFVAGGAKVGEFATVQSRVGRATAALEAAKALVHRDLAETHELARQGTPISIDRRIRSRLNQAYAGELAVQGIEIMYRATGGAGLYLSERTQRAWRDIHAMTHHASLNWDAVSSMFGQHALGYEPKGRY